MIDRNRRGSSASKTSGCRETTRSGGSGSEPGPGDITGVVLAGGHSRRFGDRDKALARLGDRTLLARVVGRLGAVVDSVVVNCRGDQRAAIAEALDLPVDSKSEADVRVRFAVDPVPDRGPLFGFRTALQTVETGTCALAACDTPFLDSHLVADLADRLTADPAAEAVAVAIGDRAHPMPAVYRTAPAREACDALLDTGDGRLSALFDRLAVRRVSADDAVGGVGRSLFDVDTPADHNQAARVIADRALSESNWEVAPTR